MPALEVKHLRYTARSGTMLHRVEKNILRDVSFSIDNGSALGLIGASGSGKTTLAKCISGLLEPTGGEIAISGTNVFPETKNRRLLGPVVQLLFQNHTASLDPLRTIRYSLSEGVSNDGEPASSETLGKLLSMVELPENILEKLPHELSGGQRQRVALARILSVSPSVVILDEPTSSLDALTQVQILKMIKELQRQTNLALLYISHDLVTTSMMCDRMVLLSEGILQEVIEGKKT